MARHGGSRRSVSELLVRGVLALAVLIAGYFAIRHTVAATVRSSDPARAHRLAPGDGEATALLAQQRFGAAATDANRALAARLGQTALRQDATAVAGAATYGLQAQLRGDTAGARAVFAYALKLSRRDLQTQLWAIEDAVGRGDVVAALRHYDVALRTSRRATDLLYPVLGSAIADPAIRAALVNTLAAAPAWRDGFVGYVSMNGTSPEATAQLFEALRVRGYRVPDEATAAVTTALVRRDALDLAWHYYTRVRGNADRRHSRDPDFKAVLVEATPFDWVTVNDEGLSASIQRGETGGVLDFAAPSGVGGVVVRQQQRLLPGGYRLEGRSGGIDQPANARPYWLLQCRGGRELGRVVLPASGARDGRFAGMLVVPRDCPEQMLSLVARPSDAVTGVSGQVFRAQLRPAAEPDR
jgi:hypothetical protein